MKRVKELRELSDSELKKRYEEMILSLMKVRAKISSGNIPENPGKVKHLKRDIARILTIMKERGIKEK